MSLHRWLQNLRSALAPGRGQGKHRRRSSRRTATHRPNLEVLEDRCVPAQYAVTALGTLGGSFSQVSDLNQAGQVAGSAYTADGVSHAFLWDNGRMIDLGTLGGNWSYTEGINDPGQVIGYANLPGDATTHAFLVTPQGGVWFRDSDRDGRNDLMTDLGTLPGRTSSGAADVNNAGQVVGWSEGHPFLWDAVHGMADLGVPPGFTEGSGMSINGAGQVLVSAYDSVSGHSGTFLWDATNGMTAWGADTGSYGAALNDAGQLAGTWNGPAQAQPSSAFLWTPDSPNGLTGSFTDLGMLPGAGDSNARAVNNAGQVVGTSAFVESVYVCEPDGDDWYCYYQDSYDPHAFFWDAAGGMVDLQDQLLPGSDAALEFPVAINDGGVIALDGQASAYVLTPVPAGTPTIGVADAPAVTEGNAGAGAATFTVTLSAESTQTITVAYATGDGTATAGSDYQAASGTLTFAPGETSKAIRVLVNGDRLGESNETFFVNLSSPSNAVIVDGQGMGTVVDDEPHISITPSLSRSEGNTGQTPFAFAVTLSSAYDAPVTVDWTTAAGTATAGSDYQAATGTLIIPAGRTTGTIPVLVNGDRFPEPNETFYVNLSGATSAVISYGLSTGTIVDDEPRISIGDVTRYEGKKNQTTLFTFTVTLSAAYDQPVTVSFRTVDGSAKTGDHDYVAQTGTLTFNPGETTKAITIVVNGDNKKEADEAFYLDLFGLSGNALFTKNRCLGTILNDD